MTTSRLLGTVTLSFLAGLSSTPAMAQSAAAPPTRSLRATKLSGAGPKIDGLVDDGVWTAIQPYGDFIQQDPREGEAATEKTEVRLAKPDRQECN